ncbi:hypothetical protein Q4598_11955 [Phaeobacter inhibens]|uniref:hypothetical protein n=1 Tax=Phaeobacter inhibens TaxID=221822 RepID=UPI0026E16995|nr:hypothetical protein [Phaeobacter inhibens]MDO6756950.1 hypothetical protein [Phaeobacter inhibens]
MDIYQFFSCLTALPIKIDTIAEYLKDSGHGDHIFFCEVDIDPDVIWAQLRVYQEQGAYGAEKKIYEIQYSEHLTHEQKRLACCKELLHILDSEAEAAASQSEVETLIQQMAIPPQAGISLPASSDHFGVIRALLILVPRDSLSEFKKAYDAGKISEDEVAKATGIPVEYARVTLQDYWSELSQRII